MLMHANFARRARMRRGSIDIRYCALLLLGIAAIGDLAIRERGVQPAPAAEIARHADGLKPFLAQYCADCHNPSDKSGGLDLDALKIGDLAGDAKPWEKVVRKLASRQMPPLEVTRPDEKTYNSVIASLADVLDADAARHPNPGRTESIRRLSRTEYQNAIR